MLTEPDQGMTDRMMRAQTAQAVASVRRDSAISFRISNHVLNSDQTGCRNQEYDLEQEQRDTERLETVGVDEKRNADEQRQAVNPRAPGPRR